MTHTKIINAALEALKRTCLRCGHAWTLRSAVEPLRCPKCGSPYWDRPRQPLAKA